MKLNVPRILFLTGMLSLIPIYALSWVDVLSDPVQRTGSDFIAFYAAGKNMMEYTPAAAYDLTYLKTQEESVLGFKIADQEMAPFMHPPFILPILWLVTHFDYIPAFYIWAFFMLVLCIISAQFAVRLEPSATGISRFALWAGIILFFPLFISLVNGQDSALLLLGAMIWYYGLTRNSDRMAGLGLALTTIRPQIALILAVPFIFSAPRRRVWWWFCLGGAVLVIFSVLLIGPEGLQNFLSILSVSTGGEGYKINESAMVNLIGLVKRLMPTLDASVVRVVGWAGALAGLIGLCVLFGKASTIDNRHISLAVIVALFVSPHLHYHDLALLIVSILILIHRLVAAGRASLELAGLILFCISLIFVFTYSISQLTYPVVYLVELVLFIYPWQIDNG